MSPNPNQPTSEAHWGTAHPEDQPDRAQVIGLGRQVMEIRARLGEKATAEAVLGELRACGVEADPADVARWLEQVPS